MAYETEIKRIDGSIRQLKDTYFKIKKRQGLGIVNEDPNEQYQDGSPGDMSYHDQNNYEMQKQMMMQQ